MCSPSANTLTPHHPYPGRLCAHPVKKTLLKGAWEPNKENTPEGRFPPSPPNRRSRGHLLAPPTASWVRSRKAAHVLGTHRVRSWRCRNHRLLLRGKAVTATLLVLMLQRKRDSLYLSIRQPLGPGDFFATSPEDLQVQGLKIQRTRNDSVANRTQNCPPELQESHLWLHLEGQPSPGRWQPGLRRSSLHSFPPSFTCDGAHSPRSHS